MFNKPKINWTVTLFLTITPIVGILGTLSLVLSNHFMWKTLVLAFVFMIITGLAITAGYHRLFAHKTYKTVWPIRLLFVLFGAATFEGSVLEWCTDHRDHHKFTDTDKDPYSVTKGFWHAHIGWLIHLDTSKRDFSNVEDLNQDPIIRIQHRFFVLTATLMGFVLPMLIAASWGDALGGLIIAGALRISVNQQLTFCINSICHWFGKRPYSERNTARDNWVTALFTYGEGYHNFHHKFPIDYRNGIRFYHFDPSKWLIQFLATCGLANDLKRVNDHRLIQYKLEMDQKRLLQIAKSSREMMEKLNLLFQPIYSSLQQVLTRIDELDTAYRQLKAKKSEYVLERLAEYREHMADYRNKLAQAKSELRSLLKAWATLLPANIVQC